MLDRRDMNHFPEVFVNFQKLGKTKDNAGMFQMDACMVRPTVCQKLPICTRNLPHGHRKTLQERKGQTQIRTHSLSSQPLCFFCFSYLIIYDNIFQMCRGL